MSAETMTTLIGMLATGTGPNDEVEPPRAAKEQR
jgi:hypothetical protein